MAFTLDILFVTYNSEKWLVSCVESIAKSDYDLKKVALYFYDNASQDQTPLTLDRLKERYAARFRAFDIRRSDKNEGFGRGNNAAAGMGQGEYIFCLNADTTLYPDTLAELEREIARDDGSTGLWELRQFPYEHPKFYDPITLETSWSSAACCVIRRRLFEKIGGFDKRLFMYGEDVDLSWRVRIEGYKLRYIPKAVVNHYCYQTSGEVKPRQYVYSIVNHLYLRHKFGGITTLLQGYKQFFKLLMRHGPFKHARTELCLTFLKSLPAYFSAALWRIRNRQKFSGKYFSFMGWDYEFIRDGAFYVNERPRGDKKVSVIVRTCGRPEVLRETLTSLRNQTYKNMEIVVVEDGEAVSRGMIERDFSELNIVYEATGVKVGRSAAGNRALSLATGEWFNFLDDDDVFFADHVETLVMELERNPQYKIAYSFAFDTPVKVLSTNPYKYEIEDYCGHVKESFNRLELLHHNLFPIQAVMFAREVYEDLGGLDEHMDALEDWDLWVRYASKYAFHMIEKTTSIYRVPADKAIDADRQRKLDEALLAARRKHTTYALCWNSEELLSDYQAGISAHIPNPGTRYRRFKGRVRRILTFLKE